MDDLIHRAEAISVASGYCHPSNIAQELAKLPSAQPEIIRCEECTWYHVLIEPQHVEYCELTECTVFRNDFCSRAERKTYE